MSKTRIRRPASDIRPARRSLVELTAAASRAIDDGLLVTSASLIAASPDNTPRSEPAAKTHDPTMVAGQVAAPIPAAVPEPLNEAAARSGELVDSDSTAEGSVGPPAIHKMSAIVELLSPCLRSALSALTGVPTKPDGTGSLRSLVLANRCVAPDHKTVPRLPILAVPSRDGCPLLRLRAIGPVTTTIVEANVAVRSGQ